MENASKALIIAGAILLAILIIGLGVMVFNNAKSAISGANLDREGVATYNEQFTQYVGTKVSGSTVKSLLGVIRSHNTTTAAQDTSLVVKVNCGSNSNKTTASEIDAIISSILVGKRYTVSCGYDAATGYVNSVTITAN